MTRCFYSLLILCLTLLPAMAQEGGVRGTVLDSDSGDPLAGANVAVDGKPVGGATGTDGSFTLSKLPEGTYRLVVTYLGYYDGQFEAVIRDGEVIDLGTLKLTPGSLSLNAVAVTASRREEKALNAPASISILEDAEFRQSAVISSADVLRNTVGVDVSNTGIDRREMVLRGFNHAFTGATRVLTDYRQAAVPSLDVNVHSAMPNMQVDIDRVEVVRGPGSALYGPGVDAGVIHYLTRDPFQEPGTAVSLSAGERGSAFGQLRHAALISDNLAYKITAQMGRADDWEYDPEDPQDAAELSGDFVDPQTGEQLQRVYDYEKINVNGLLKLKLGSGTTLSASGGYSSLHANILSGIGTLRSEGFGNSYAQLRLQSGGWFAQAYLNANEAGDSYIYGTGSSVVDKGRQWNVQTQYNFDTIADRHQLVAGVDFDQTIPDTRGTILGRYEDEDEIREIGAYLQTQSRLSERFDLIMAIRGDQNNVLDGLEFSPRLALVYKPSTAHTWRATYNRAVALPGVNQLFLDIEAQRLEFGDDIAIIARGLGAVEGYTYDQSRRDGAWQASSLLPVERWFGETLSYSDATTTLENVPLSVPYQMIYDALTALSTEEIQMLLADLDIVVDANTVDIALAFLNPQLTIVEGLAETKLSAEPTTIAPLGNTVTQSVELGYKGVINNRVLVSVDGYISQKKGFIGSLRVESPLVEWVDLPGRLVPALAAAIANNPPLASILVPMNLDANEFAEQLVAAAGSDLTDFPVAAIQPDGYQQPGDVLLTFRNYGEVVFWGVDAAVDLQLTRNLTLFGNLSLVSDNFFDYMELNESAVDLALALNAPTFKFKAGFGYQRPGGYGLGASGRFVKGFPVQSGLYIGGRPDPFNDPLPGVSDYFLLDLRAGYDLSGVAAGLRIDAEVQNVLDHRHREFVGAPELGRFSLVRLSYQF